MLVTFSSVFLMLTTFFYVFMVRLNSKEYMFFRLSLLFIFSFLLGSLNTRVSQYYVPFFIVATTSMIAKWDKKLYKVAYIIFVLCFLAYAFFIVWMGTPYFSYRVYHSLIGDM
jgi:hypothetical protein